MTSCLDFPVTAGHKRDSHCTVAPLMAHDEANVFTLEPGETKEMTRYLTEPGELIFGCHQTGHYAAGMLGTLTVES